MKVRFADCQLDLDARLLHRGGKEIHLSPKAFATLKLLVEMSPRAVAKVELLDRVWPGTFVTDASLARVISEIRGAIGDRARDGAMLRTVHGYGYAFAAEFEQSASTEARPRVCWLIYGIREVGLSEGDHIIGREPTVAVCLDSPRVSRHHARVTVRGMTATIMDLNSKNGVFVGGTRLTQATPLQSGDVIRIGPFTIFVRFGDTMASTLTEAILGRPD